MELEVERRGWRIEVDGQIVSAEILALERNCNERQSKPKQTTTTLTSMRMTTN